MRAVAACIVVDLRSLVPLDWEVVVYDQGHLTCGIAVTIAAGLQQRAYRDLRGPVVPLASADVPIPYNTAIEEEVVPDAERLVRAIRELLGPEGYGEKGADDAR
jgi:pyruvate/2-oxoglutarate/acetoin dehydrogenase E1 component